MSRCNYFATTVGVMCVRGGTFNQRATDFAPPCCTRYANTPTRNKRPPVSAAANDHHGTLNAPDATLVSFVLIGLIVLAKIASHP